MPFLLIPGNGAEYIKEREPDFADIRAYLLSLEPPRIRSPIDRALAEQGKAIFEQTCVRCHGAYGADGRYPNKLVPLDVIGTDADPGAPPSPRRAWRITSRAGSPASTVPRESPIMAWAAAATRPLRSTASGRRHLIFHNGSVPTVYHVLKSSERPEVFTRSFRGDAEEYDQRQGGPEGHQTLANARRSQPARDRAPQGL